jgi:hypothetical protein
MALKLDMSKAYDLVEWAYVESIMRKMGFAERWISLVMECIRTVQFSVLIDGVPKGFINPTRGIRQGDPLSPYIFLLCAEGLSALLQKASSSGRLKGIQSSRGGPWISHLFFADDSLLFGQASITDCRKILDILNVYEQCSGQKINREKTASLFQFKYCSIYSARYSGLLGLPRNQQLRQVLGFTSNDWKIKKSHL